MDRVGSRHEQAFLPRAWSPGDSSAQLRCSELPRSGGYYDFGDRQTMEIPVMSRILDSDSQSLGGLNDPSCKSSDRTILRLVTHTEKPPTVPLGRTESTHEFPSTAAFHQLNKPGTWGLS